MHRGRVVERGATADVLDHPQQPYTQLLRASVPRPGWKPTRARARSRPKDLPHDPPTSRSSTGASAPSTPGGRTPPRSASPADAIVAVGDDAVDPRRRGRVRPRSSTSQARRSCPGIIDSHIHPFLGALGARGADLHGRPHARGRPRGGSPTSARAARPGEWVLGYGLDYNVFADTGISRRADRRRRRRRAGAADVHRLPHRAGDAARARARRASTARGAFTEHAEVVVDAAGAPTGELRETGAMDLVRDAMPPLTDAERYTLQADQLRRFAAVGLTGLHGMDGTLATLDTLRELEANGDLVTRMVMPFWSQPDTPEEVWEEYARHRTERGERWRMGVAKLFIDGVIDTGHGLARGRPTPRATGSSRSGPTSTSTSAPSTSSRARAFRSSPTPPATAACARRWTPTSAPAPRPGSSIASSTSRRCSPKTCPASPPRASSRRCRPST